MNGVIVRASRVQLPNNAFESGRADKQRVLARALRRRAAQLER